MIGVIDKRKKGGYTITDISNRIIIKIERVNVKETGFSVQYILENVNESSLQSKEKAIYLYLMNR